jgi:glycosyltransferase involved in cell wall biosynthesis
VQSIRDNCTDHEIILIDEGSTDGSCQNQDVDLLIRHETRIGIAYSRNEGVNAAHGEVYAFVDAHQRVTKGCFEACAEVALARQAIAWPCVRGLDDRGWAGHGAWMRQKTGNKNGLFDGKWVNRCPKDTVSRCNTMIVPGYLIPASVYPKVRPADGLRGWGASEPAMTVRAFFAKVKVLHVCGYLCRHMFRVGKHIPYPTPWAAVARNHALTARVCFSDETWENYWMPKVFHRWLRGELCDEFYSPAIVDQCLAFREIKRKQDIEFWTHCLMTDPPRQVKRIPRRTYGISG